MFHLAAQAGVRDSFGESFGQYAATTWSPPNACSRRPRPGARGSCGPRRRRSTATRRPPCREDSTPTLPRSPYGVTKRACEDLARVYRTHGLPITGLRYFTVYGPRQRPDMAMRRICDALVSNATFPLFGDGSQSRDFTFVTDAVDATVRCAHSAAATEVYNVGGARRRPSRT